MEENPFCLRVLTPGRCVYIQSGDSSDFDGADAAAAAAEACRLLLLPATALYCPGAAVLMAC